MFFIQNENQPLWSYFLQVLDFYWFNSWFECSWYFYSRTDLTILIISIVLNVLKMNSICLI